MRPATAPGPDWKIRDSLPAVIAAFLADDAAHFVAEVEKVKL
jgi:hypothetical protein